MGVFSPGGDKMRQGGGWYYGALKLSDFSQGWWYNETGVEGDIFG